MLTVLVFSHWFCQVAKKLLELHAHLRDLGHPDYLKAEKSFFLHCQICSENADAEVNT